jgi:hypothetical protein
MSGLYDRLGSNSNTKIPIHYFNGVMVVINEGVVADAAAAIVKLNNRLSVELTAQDSTDLTNIVAQLDAKATTTDKLQYILLVGAVSEAVESDDLTDGQFRSILGIA